MRCIQVISEDEKRVIILRIEKEKEKRKKDDSNIAIGVNRGVASSSSCSKSICNPAMRITTIRWP